MKSKLEIMVPIWPTKGAEQYWGSNDYVTYNYSDSVTSTWLSLRAVEHNDDNYYMGDSPRAINDFGVYVWMSTDGTVCLDLRLHDCHSLTEQELEIRLKHLKALRKKVAKKYQIDCFQSETTVHAELTRFLVALGVWRSIEYVRIDGKSKDKYDAIGIAVNRIADTLDARLDKLGRKTA